MDSDGVCQVGGNDVRNRISGWLLLCDRFNGNTGTWKLVCLCQNGCIKYCLFRFTSVKLHRPTFGASSVPFKRWLAIWELWYPSRWVPIWIGGNWRCSCLLHQWCCSWLLSTYRKHLASWCCVDVMRKRTVRCSGYADLTKMWNWNSKRSRQTFESADWAAPIALDLPHLKLEHWQRRHRWRSCAKMSSRWCAMHVSCDPSWLHVALWCSNGLQVKHNFSWS